MFYPITSLLLLSAWLTTFVIWLFFRFSCHSVKYSWNTHFASTDFGIQFPSVLIPGACMFSVKCLEQVVFATYSGVFGHCSLFWSVWGLQPILACKVTVTHSEVFGHRRRFVLSSRLTTESKGNLLLTSFVTFRWVQETGVQRIQTRCRFWCSQHVIYVQWNCQERSRVAAWWLYAEQLFLTGGEQCL